MNKNLLKYLKVLIILAIGILAIYLVRLIKLYDIFCLFLEIILPIFFGYAIAWIMHPFYKKASKKINKKLSFFLFILGTILIYTVIIWIFLPILINEFKNLIEIFKSFIPKLEKIPYFNEIKNYFTFDSSIILNSCNNIISILINFVLAHMFGFYILYNYESINYFVKSYLPLKYKDLLIKFSRKISSNMRLFLKGTIIDMIALFFLSAVLFSIFKFKYSILLALFCAITNVIPFIGPYIGGIPAVIVGLSQSLNMGIVALIIVIISQTIETNVINPLIMSKCIKINPLFIVIAITVMGKFFGIIGMVFAVPTLILLKLSLEFYKKNKQNLQS